MTLCLSLSAQTYNMVITKADGSIVLVPADEVSNVSFVAQEPVVDVPRHFDITVTVGKQGGMGRDLTTIMQTRKSLSEGNVIDFKNAGAEINADYTMEAIVKGKYYYQVPVSADRFVKLQFKDNKMEVVQAQPFVENTYKTRAYCHAWLNDNTLLIMSANGDKDKIIWTKLNTDDMKVISEGTLNISLLDGYDTFTSTGIVAYRKSDNKLFYFYYNKKAGTTSVNATNEPNFHVAVINPETMAVEQDNINTDKVAEMAGSAYGELLQQTTFFDEAGNLYLAAFNDVEKDGQNCEIGSLLRIKNGEYNFEAGYNGFPESEGKLLTTQYLGNGKVFCYSRHDDKTLGTKIDSYSHYYSVVDLNAKTRTRIQYNGQDIDYSSGRFSQRSAVDLAAGKVYFGVNTKDAAPSIYVYDIKTGEVTKGVDVSEGYYFEQIRIVED
jgi:hypothetical protein